MTCIVYNVNIFLIQHGITCFTIDFDPTTLIIGQVIVILYKSYNIVILLRCRKHQFRFCHFQVLSMTLTQSQGHLKLHVPQSSAKFYLWSRFHQSTLIYMWDIRVDKIAFFKNLISPCGFDTVNFICIMMKALPFVVYNPSFTN